MAQYSSAWLSIAVFTKGVRAWGYMKLFAIFGVFLKICLLQIVHTFVPNRNRNLLHGVVGGTSSAHHRGRKFCWPMRGGKEFGYTIKVLVSILFFFI